MVNPSLFFSTLALVAGVLADVDGCPAHPPSSTSISTNIATGITTAAPTGTLAPPVPPPCATPFNYAEGDCMVKLDGLSHLLSVLGSNKRNPKIFAVAPVWGIGHSYHMDILKPFAHDYTFVFLTPAGTHPSERPPNPLDISVTHSVLELEALRVWLRLDKIHVQGHSAGGSSALLYAEEYPDHVASLTLLETCLEDYDDSATFGQFLTGWQNDPRYQSAIAALGPAINISDPNYPTTDAGFAAGLMKILPLYFAEPQKYVSLLIKELQSDPLPDVYANTENTISIGTVGVNGIQAPNYKKLSQVKAPTLVVVGEKDMFCSVKVAKIINSGIRGSKLRIIKDAGHFGWYENRQKWYHSVGAFWMVQVKGSSY